MGRRHPDSRFVPNSFVFPGGAVDPEDMDLITPHGLEPNVAARLPGNQRDAHAAAAAAVREAYEETGLSLTKGEGIDNGDPAALDALDYLARAITPEASPIRYDTMFFIADGNLARGDLVSSGELLDLDWYPLAETGKLPRIDITVCILELVLDAVASGRTIGPGLCDAPCQFQWRNGRWVRGSA